MMKMCFLIQKLAKLFIALKAAKAGGNLPTETLEMSFGFEKLFMNH